MNKPIEFPKDFEMSFHTIIPGAVHYKHFDEDNNMLYSVVGGGMGLYGDGISTFEMFDCEVGDLVLEYADQDEINEYLRKKYYLSFLTEEER